ncbi:trypsin-1-like [Parasteatoda tepidariorum]|uniref:trypsin-1-like n=1 Tax=Parasteatoda tepidariorum TaxID=114398 RepID=UPI00077FA39C|nr:serine proteinase stubble-like [Parasteatoda tepidariorum]
MRARVLFFDIFVVLVGFAEQQTSVSNNVQCGKPLGRKPKIVGGENAEKGEFPFLVSLRGPEEPRASNVLHKCGAVLLSERWLLTAAHCVFEYRRKKYLPRLRVRLGEYDVSSSTTTDRQDLGVEELIAHPQYQEPYRQSNDIALLRLNKPAILSENVWPACLPDAGMQILGLNATVAGWGQASFSGPAGEKTILQKIVVPVMSNGACLQMYFEAGHTYPLEDNQMCAGYREGGKDSCQGDSGGPLFVKHNNLITVIGLVSAGIYCGSPLLPGIYTRVISHLDWIRQNIKD